MINIVIQRSHNPKKKYDAIMNGNKTISFGAVGYEDHTTHKDEKRRQNYINRHSNEDWSRTFRISCLDEQVHIMGKT